MTNKIIEFQIIRGFNCKDLEKTVNEFISRGYQPFGSMIIYTDGIYYQPVVKYDENK